MAQESTTVSFHGVLASALEGSVDAERLQRVLASPAAALPVPSAGDRIAWDLGGSGLDAPAARAVLERADADRSRPWPVPLASLAAEYHRSGDRDGYEQQVFARQRRLSRAVVAATITLSDAWLDEVVDGVQLLCEQSSWCWPAHDHAFARHGSMLPWMDDPYLDLGAGEIAGQLAWIDHLLGDRLDARCPGLRARIRHEVRVRVLGPFVARRDWPWLGLDGHVNNWNPWIHGNVLVAALRLLDHERDAALRLDAVELVVEGLDRYVTALPVDGAVDEGTSYWWEGACRALEALDVLSFATGGRIDPLAGITSLRAAVAFPHRMQLGGPWYLNVADGRARSAQEQPWHALHRAAMRVGDADARAHAAAHRGDAVTEGPGLGRLLRALTDPEWIAARPPAGTPWLPRDVWLPSTEVMISRPEAASPRGLTLAVKGGHNDESHNHNDVGSFVVAVDGVPVIVDAGRPTYTAATFGPDRYDIWTMQSSWHNVPEIRGRAQRPGRSFAASGVGVRADADTAEMSLDISAAYAVPGLRSWRRTAWLERGRPRVVIADRWDDESADDAPTVLHLLLAGEVSVHSGRARVTPLDGARPVVLRWPADVRSDVSVRDLDDPVLVESWGQRLTRIELDVSDRTEFAITVDIDENDFEDAR